MLWLCSLVVVVVIFFSYKFLSFPNVIEGSSDGLSCELIVELCGPRNKVDVVLFCHWWHIFSCMVLWLDGGRFLSFGLSCSGDPLGIGLVQHWGRAPVGLLVGLLGSRRLLLCP